MPNDLPQPEKASHVLFSVCASPDVTTAANQACEQLRGTEFVGEFNDYFTPDRRPQISYMIKTAAICVAIVDCDRDPELALVTMERLRIMGLKGLSVVAYSSRSDAAYLLRAMRAGCHEFLTKPADTNVLRDALQRLEAVQLMGATVNETVGRVISLYGAKGGVGTTTLAVHLACNLVVKHRKRTLLIDHRHELGHVALYLGMKESLYHFGDLILNADRLDSDLLNGFISRHNSGLEVLASPDNCSVAHKSNAEELDLVLSFLRTQYDYIVIDSSLGYKDIVPPMLRISDEIYLVSTPDVAALRDLARRMEFLTLNDETSRKLRIMINRSTSDDAVTPEQIERIVKVPVWMTVPNAYQDLVKAINAGAPIAVHHRSAFASQINKWTTKMLSDTLGHAEKYVGPAKKRFSFFKPRREQTA